MHMAGNAARDLRLEVVKLSPCPPLEKERKLDRLRELRATIDALRGEREAEDPLLAWVLAQQETATPHHG
jgi:hypothetical protein